MKIIKLLIFLSTDILNVFCNFVMTTCRAWKIFTKKNEQISILSVFYDG